MKPSDLPTFEDLAMPYVGTFRKSEREIAAALFVAACRANGDVWQSIEPRKIGQVIMAHAESGDPPTWISVMQIGIRPDFHGLVDDGFLAWDGPEGKGRPLVATEKFFEALKRWATPS